MSASGTVFRNAFRRVIVLVCLLVLPGCGYTYHFKNTDAVRGDEHRQWASFFFFGLLGDYELDVRELCAKGDVYEITTGTSFLTWLVSGSTLGIYTPRKVIVWCKANPSTALQEGAAQ